MNKPIDDIKIHIACATDDGFAYPLAVMIASVLENHKNQKICIHLFSALLSEINKSKIEQIVKKYNQEFIFYRLNPLDFEAFPTSERISSAAYYRLLMPGKINKNVKRFLYLDADVIVTDDLTPLFELDMGESIFGAIHDIVAIDWNLHKKHNIPDQFLYFNSGVLLIDREKWETINATQKVTNYIVTNYNLCEYHDQDGLNGALYQYRYNLSPIWNQQIGIYFVDKTFINSIWKDADIAIEKPIIVHFNGMEKPWNLVSAHPYKKQFRYYAQKITELSYHEPFKIKKFLKRVIVYGFKGWVEANKEIYYKTRKVHQ